MDRLVEAIAEKGGNPSLVGLDPKPALLPTQLIRQAVEETDRLVEGQSEACAKAGANGRDDIWLDRLAQAYLRFNLAVLDGVADVVPAVKPQIAMYEALGLPGIRAYMATCRAAGERGLFVIGDVKRGDIGSTADAYASHLSGPPLTYRQAVQGLDGHGDAEPPGASGAAVGSPWMEDAITVNPYLGSDGIEPFVRAAGASKKDLFVLVRTSNPSSDQIQELPVVHGPGQGERLYQRIGDLVQDWGSGEIGTSGYSRVGAVAGATHPRAGAELHQRMPHTFFLVPGFGAQGGNAKDVAPMFDAHGCGAIVNSSRGIIAAWRKESGYRPDLSVNATLGVVSTGARRSAVLMKQQLLDVLKEDR
ncbi:orotidine-5'-phosphate decarboxylase [Bifidobacterium xylocopae]|uniref:Orotidine 5'-phosphate decarboxylase n=1 Tax=Bifidobacterium xylocopae TaxID=2493119 RepID=A0A366KC48_9BIFI|nr:orotidine-5'-phosphate decarboxylase [Bifidobacterium xylocopae]RBP99315.1 orotidine-5'-phosphate decarboxylase [Bifidobacterium xylocopae]